jgi:hypothetical protein
VEVPLDELSGVEVESVAGVTGEGWDESVVLDAASASEVDGAVEEEMVWMVVDASDDVEAVEVEVWSMANAVVDAINA